jgi:hypothetical protein
MAATGHNILTTSDTISFRDQTTGFASIAFDHATETLNISHDGTGAISFGDTSSDIFIGDGTSSVDIIFEVDGAIKGESNVNLTLGASDSNLLIASENATITGSQIASESYVTSQISSLVGGAPAALDTLNELAAAIGDDASYASSITTALAGKQVAGTYNTIIGTDSDITTSNAEVVNNIYMTDGVITSHTKRTLTLANLGYTGATNANNYSLPLSTSSTRGGVKIGFSESGKNYPVELSSEKMYVNVPWTDTNTVYSLPLSTSSTRGGVKIGFTESGKNYPVELSSEKMYVNVPWTDSNTTYSVGDGGLTQKNFTTTLKSKLDGIATSANNYSLPAGSSSTRGGFKIGYTESGKNYPVEVSSEKMYVNVPWSDSNTTYSVGDGGLTQKNFTSTLKTKLDGIETGATADQTAAQILALIKTVDGTGSGLDADLLDGQTGSYYTGSKGQSQNYVASSSSTSNRGNYGAGVWAYSGYSTGTDRPFTYDSTLQVMPTASMGFELSTDWHSSKGQLKIRSLRDCCEGWSAYSTIWTSANFANNSTNWNTAYGWGNHASAGYVTSSGNTIIGTDSDIDTSGATVVDQLVMTDGVITSHSTRTLTLANLGYTGATNANNYSLPAGSSSTRGGFKIGFSESGKNYPVELSSEKMYVNVPWTDTNTNTTYSAGNGISLSSTTFSVAAGGGLTQTSTGLSHTDTSSQGSVNNSSGTVIQDITLDTYGHITSLGSTNLDSRYYTESEVQTFFKRGYINAQNAGNLAVGWYTIAQNTGDRAFGEFQIWDTASSRHQSVIFNAAHHHGQNDSNSITVLGNSSYGTHVFRYVRIKENGTYDGAAIQVYIDNSTNGVNVAIVGGNAQNSGWELVDWLADSSAPSLISNWSGASEQGKIDLDNIENGGIATTGKIYGDGLQTQYRMFNDNYHPNADRLTTGRTITLGGDLSGSAEFTGASDITITAAVSNNSHTHTIANITSLQSSLNAKAALASPALTGTPTAPTAASNTNSTQIATTAYVQTEITDLIGGAPGALNTLNELAAAIGDDASYASSITTALAGKQVAGTYNTIIGTDSDINTSGATVVDQLNMTDGVIQSHSTRTLTLANLGYTGATNANNYSLPLSTSSTRGGVKIGFAESGKNYPVELSSEKMYVNVPWTDTNTVYSLPAGSSSTRGGFKIGFSESGKNYPVEVSSEKMYVNVPWTDTNTTYSVGDGGLTQKNFTTTLKSKLDGIATGATNVTNNNQLTNGAGYVTSSGNTIIGTDSDINTSGAAVLDQLVTTDGVITSHSTRNLTLANLGYTGATNANYITNNNQLTNGAGYADEYVNLAIASGASHDTHHWNKTHAAYSNNSGSPTYIVLTTSIPQNNYSMGGFTLILQNNYSAASEGDVINIYGYWNPEGNGGFTGFRYHTSNPECNPTIQVGRNSSGNTVFLISGESGSYAQVVAKDMWTGYSANSASSSWGDGWAFSEASSTTGISNLDTLTRNGISATNVSNWNTAYTDRNKWDGGSTGLTASTGRTSLGLGSAATQNTSAFATANQGTSAETAFGWGNHASAGYVTSSGNTIIGTDSDINTSGATVVDQLNMTDGVIQSHSTRTLTLANLGYTGATNANNYSLPAGSSSTRGGFKIGFTESGKNYPVELSSEKMYVNVPWTDTNTTYSVGDGGLTQKNFTTTLKTKLDGIATNANNYVLPTTLSGNRTIGGDLTVSGNQVITTGSNADVKFSVWSGTTYGIGMTSGVTYGGLNDYAMTFCMNNESDRGFWWGYSGQTKSAGAMSLTTAGVLTVASSITAGGAVTGSNLNISNWNTAYGWGNHASAGYVTSNTQLSTEQVQDAVGAMLTGNTESGITVTYDDTNNEIDFTVASQTDQNFTTTLKNKLDGIAAGATNVTNNNQLSNGAGYVTSSGNTVIGTDSDINTSGATVVDQLNMTDGVITSHSTRTLTLANLGYTGATNANNYSLPEATATVRGGIELFSNTDQSVAANSVSATSGRTYGIQLNSSGQAVVNVPWTDTNTTYSVGDGGLTQKNFTSTLKTKLDGIATSANNYSLPAGSSSTRGGFKIGFSESGKNYPVEVSSEQMYVNVPWTDTNTDTNTTYSAGRGLDLSGTQFLLETDLRDSISYIGYDSNDYIQWSNNSWCRTVVSGSERLRVKTDGIDVTGVVVANAIRTKSASTSYSLLTRNTSASNYVMYVQATQSGGTQKIATYGYGSGTAGQATEVFRIARGSINAYSSNLTVGGSITGNSKNFSIPHPTKEGKRLVHSCLEGPEIGVYFRGRSQSSTIEMPDYWSSLVHLDSMTVELTAIGPNQDLYVEDIADDGDVTIGSNTETALNYFYVVYGERKDMDKLEIEVDDTGEFEGGDGNSEESEESEE